MLSSVVYDENEQFQLQEGLKLPTAPAPERAPWPRMFTPAADLLEWLGKQRPLTEAGKKRILTLRWLVHAELDRTEAGLPRATAPAAPHVGPD